MNCVPFDDGVADFVIYLDYGTDCSFGHFGELAISERGMIFRSQWRFQLGTQLGLHVCAKASCAEEVPVCVELTGLVVNCEKQHEKGRGYEVTLLFLNVTEQTQRKIRLLAARPELAGDPAYG